MSKAFAWCFPPRLAPQRQENKTGDPWMNRLSRQANFMLPLYPLECYGLRSSRLVESVRLDSPASGGPASLRLLETARCDNYRRPTQSSTALRRRIGLWLGPTTRYSRGIPPAPGCAAETHC